MKKYTYPVVLSIAGSDSGGGAGIQADLKTFSALGCYGTSVITAVTAQNTLGVTAIHSIPAEIVKAQLEAVLNDITPHAIKIGMIHTPELVFTIGSILKEYVAIPLVLDPVMATASGDKLIENETIAALQNELFPLAALITPNLDEAAVLCSMPIKNVSEMENAAADILHTGCPAVLLKGGHLKGERVFDVYVNQKGEKIIFEFPRINSNNIHGTGCTLSSAIAAYLALGYGNEDAIREARKYTYKAIKQGKNVLTGHGAGPLNHFFNPQKMRKYISKTN